MHRWLICSDRRGRRYVGVYQTLTTAAVARAMVAFPLRRRLVLPIASTGAGLAATLIGVVMMLAPADLLETYVMAVGLPAAFSAVELGSIARPGLAFAAASVIGSVLWAALRSVFGTRVLAIAEPLLSTRGAPIVHRGGTHQKASPRRPLMASEELGTPFLEVRAQPKPPVERALPKNLDAPLADFDPDALPEVPAEPVRAVASLAPKPMYAPRERLETFELRPKVAKPIELDQVRAYEPILQPQTEATIHALLDRLEQGVASRARPKSQPVANTRGLQDTLAELRQMAVRAS